MKKDVGKIVLNYAEISARWLLKKIALFLVFIIKTLFVKPLVGLWQAIGEGLRKMLVKALEAVGERIGWVIGWALTVFLTMSWTANDYSFFRTFSWDGILVLWETFK